MNFKFSINIFLTFLCISQLYPQQNLDENTQFKEKMPGWFPTLGVVRAKVDSSMKVNANYPLNFYQMEFVDLDPLNCYIEKYSAFPELGVDSIDVIYSCRTEGLVVNDLYITTLDKYENRLRTDTIKALTNNTWTTFEKRVNVENCQFLDLIIVANGGNTRNMKQNLWIDRVEVFANNSLLNDSSFHFESSPTLSAADIVPLTLESGLGMNNITELQSKGIIALGETLHGSESVNNLVFNQVIKHQVTHNNCKLILLELPTEAVLSLNRYIHGDERFKLTSHRDDSLDLLYSYHSIEKMLIWLKDYNSNIHNKKVNIAGIDLSPHNEITISYLSKYLNKLNQKSINPLIATLHHNLSGKLKKNMPISGIISSEEREKNALGYLQTYKTAFQKIFGEFDYKVVVQALFASVNTTPSLAVRLQYRDVVMGHNAIELINNFCPIKPNSDKQSKTIIYSHLCHANPISASYITINPSMGKVIKNEFKDNYYVIGLLVGDGTVLKTAKPNYQQSLTTPPTYSLEALCKKTSFDYFFFKTSSVSSSPLYFRNLGYLLKENQFHLMSPQGRMDAAIFLHTSLPVNNSTSY